MPKRLSRRVALLAGLGLCLIPAAAAICWRPVVLRYHLWHLSHGPCAYRDAAFRYLLRWNGAEDSQDHHVDEAVILAQENGRSMLAVFEPDDDGDSQQGERLVWLFDDEADLTHMGEVSRDGFKDFTGDGIPELAIESAWVTVILSASQVERPLLIVCGDDTGDFWSCRLRPSSPGIHDVEIGRGLDEDFAPVATYVWSPEARAYLGPEGGEGHPFVRLEGWEDLSAFLSSPGSSEVPESAR